MMAEQLCWDSLPQLQDYRLKADFMLCNAIAEREEHVMRASLEQTLPAEAEPDAVLMKNWLSGYLPHLKTSPGFVLAVFPESWTDLRLRYAYALFCHALGSLNNRYGWFFDVKDQGLDYKKQAIPVSKTRDSTGFHTDSTAAEYFPDLVGLLCLHPAQEGGDSLMVNAANLFAYLQKENPEALKVLSQPLLRDVITPGAEQNKEAILQNRVPVFAVKDGRFLFRYMRFWTERAYEKTGTPAPAGLKEALDQVDAFFEKEEMMLSFRMQRGEVLMLNNSFICHNRTAFLDPGPDYPSRLLVRAWVNW